MRLEPRQSVNLLRMSTSGPKKILTLISRRKACSDPLSFCYTAIPQLHHIVQRTHASAVSRCHIHLYLLHINYTCAHCLVPDVHFLHLHFNHKAKTSSIFHACYFSIYCHSKFPPHNKSEFCTDLTKCDLKIEASALWLIQIGVSDGPKRCICIACLLCQCNGHSN